MSASAPFIACGVLKIVYDISLFFMFRNVKPPEEERVVTERTVPVKPLTRASLNIRTD